MSETRTIEKHLQQHDLAALRHLIGNVSPEQLRSVDCFVSKRLGVFIPAVGPCLYSLSPRHTHPSYLFVLTADDYCSVVFEDRTVTFDSNKLYVISPGIPHQEKPIEGFSRYIAILADKQFFEGELNHYGISRSPLFKGAAFDPPADLKFHIKDFMNEYEAKNPGSENVLEAIALQITHVLARTILHLNEGTEQVGQRMEIYNVIEYLNLHYGEDISIPAMARVANLSISHFSRLFKAETGTSPMDYLNQVRLDKARKLLRSSDKPITQVALECGFNSPAYFTTMFQRRFRVQPSHYRKDFK